MDWRSACQELSFGPAATKRLDQLNAGYQTLACKLGVGAFGGKCVPAGVHDFDVSHNAGTITIRGQIRCAPRTGNCALLGFRLNSQMIDSRKAVFHLAKSDEDLLAIERGRFFKSGLRMFVIRAIATARKDGQ